NDATPAAALEDGMAGNDMAVLENADLVGCAVHFDRSPTGAVRHAVEIAVNGDHAVAGDASLEPQDGPERSGCERLELGTFLGEMLGDNAPGRCVDARVGHLIEPLTELHIEIVEVSEAPAEEEVLTDVAERPLDLSLRFGPIR